MDPRYGKNDPHFGMPKGHLPVRSYLAVPVISRSGEVLGALFFGHPAVGVFTERAERLVAGIASQAAIAIDNARLYDAAQKEIAERKRAEAKLRESEDALREADRRKDEFLATLAHELRNPLAPIRNAVEIMRLAQNDPIATASARSLVERQLKQLVRLIDDLLDVSRITQGRLELRREKVDLATALRTALETSRPLIQAKSHSVHVAWPGTPLFVDVDATRIAQVFANLLNNSAKYSAPGSAIAVELFAEKDAVVVTVTDNGVGIPPAMLGRVFEMFERVPRTSDGVQEGLGIGLTLARRLVELHGGSVTAHSAGLNQGSTFTVRLPAWQPLMSAASLATRASGLVTRAPEAARRRILVADDNRDAATSLAMLLEMEGHDVRRAYDGIEALQIADEFRPDVAVLDLGMPRLDGYGAARELRGREWAKDMLLLALTGWGQQGDKRLALEAGFDRHLTKPIDPDTLRALVAGARATAERDVAR
jgi:signal transduction histidine kinase/ActR/RegA family two-component response regulator